MAAAVGGGRRSLAVGARGCGGWRDARGSRQGLREDQGIARAEEKDPSFSVGFSKGHDDCVSWGGMGLNFTSMASAPPHFSSSNLLHTHLPKTTVFSASKDPPHSLPADHSSPGEAAPLLPLGGAQIVPAGFQSLEPEGAPLWATLSPSVQWVSMYANAVIPFRSGLPSPTPVLILEA